ncbi:hypothetical protein [Clostridium tetani]|uniref:Uncharacterized protein n=1 Tax=Clostridium tetani TaxID=1513 RepID=A0ABC8EGN3_CLOTA|nr:hypothetical protein [Clostridium tetani]BDR82527.1 hypothetical protein K234311028_p20100 [Clostridium tetani]
MKEVLTMGDIRKDFERLGVTVRQTYNGEDYGVYEVTDKELKILCNDPDIDGTWEDGGWRYCEGSNQIKPDSEILINNKVILAWYDYDEDFENEEEKQEYLIENNGVIELERYGDLLGYLCDHMGCSQPRNVCALTKDLAKYNGMKLSELFKIYQG